MRISGVKVSASRSSRAIVSLSAGSPSTRTGSGGSCRTPRLRGRIRIAPVTRGWKRATTSRTAEGNTFTPRTISMSSVRPMQRARSAVRPQAHLEPQTRTWARASHARAAPHRPEARHHLAAGRGKHVPSAHDQHVVGATDAARAQRRAAAGALRAPDSDMVAAAKAQQRRRLAREVRVHELAFGAVGELLWRTRVGIDELDVDELTGREVHTFPRRAFAPQRRRDVADSHDLENFRVSVQGF